MNGENFTQVFKDLSILYELSLAVGQSLDLKTNCDGFLKVLMARKNLSFVSVWIKNARLCQSQWSASSAPIQDDMASLVYANPQSFVREQALALDHPMFARLNKQETYSLSGDQEYFSEFITEKGIAGGVFGIFALGDIGALKLYSMNKDQPFTPEELNQLKNVTAKFAVSLEGNIAHQKMIQEVSERKRAEEALRENERFLDTIIENIPDMIFVKDATELRFLRFNKAGEDLLGYSRQELIGKNDYDFFPRHEADFFRARDREVLAAGRLCDIPAEPIRTRHQGERILHTQEIPVLDDQGNPRYLLGISEDTTERRKTEAALRKAHEELELRVAARTAELSRANRSLRSEIAERRRMEARLHKAKEMAESASRAKSEFLANMSHELRTPLNHIIGFTELVVDRNFGELTAVQEEYLKDVLYSSKHLLSLINDILDLSKVEAGKLELNPSRIRLASLLENSLIMIREKAMKRGIQLSTHFDNIPEEITADERKLKQIIYNLLANAVKFTSDQGAIHLRASLVPGFALQFPRHVSSEVFHRFSKADKCFIKIVVQDTGIGLQSQDLNRIFEPFDQVESSASRRFQGTGLGLSLAKKLVELQNGSIWVESEGLGKGSRFAVIIPAQAGVKS
ncbi:MAG: PAS domain S-box protein [Desulfobacterales bacterium]|nr:MAG: PAS domain S-box protein [Desulfobacterales bacterium]